MHDLGQTKENTENEIGVQPFGNNLVKQLAVIKQQEEELITQQRAQLVAEKEARKQADKFILSENNDPFLKSMNIIVNRLRQEAEKMQTENPALPTVLTNTQENITNTINANKASLERGYGMYNQYGNASSAIHFLQVEQGKCKESVINQIDKLLNHEEVNKHPEWKKHFANSVLEFFKAIPIIGLSLQSRSGYEVPAAQRINALKEELQAMKSTPETLAPPTPGLKK